MQKKSFFEYYAFLWILKSSQNIIHNSSKAKSFWQSKINQLFYKLDKSCKLWTELFYWQFLKVFEKSFCDITPIHDKILKNNL